MKFDPTNWQEVPTNEEIEARKGRLQLRCSAPAALYITAHGQEALYGYAADFDAEVTEAVSFRVEAAEGVRAFGFIAARSAVMFAGEVFTNIDRMPNESGNLNEVTRAMRVFELQRRAALREIRAERDALVAAKAKEQEAKEDKKSDDQADDDAKAEEQEAKA